MWPVNNRKINLFFSCLDRCQYYTSRGAISVISLANTKFEIELFQYSMSFTRWHTERQESFFVLSSSKTTTIICSMWRKRRKINAEIEIFRFWNRLYHPSITCIHHFHYYTLNSFLLQFYQHPYRPESLCNYLHRHHVQEDFFYCVTFWIFKRKWYALFVSESILFSSTLSPFTNQT